MNRIVIVVLVVFAVVQGTWTLLSAQHIPRVTPEHKQLFVDDYLIGKLVNVKRTLHQPVKHPDPLIQPVHPWENFAVQTRTAPFWVPEEKVWKFFYMAFAKKGKGVREQHTSLYAVSKDGLRWDKPVLNLVEWDGSKANNLVAEHDRSEQFLYHVVYDPHDVPERRYKGMFGIGKRQPAVSPDGFHWTPLEVSAVPSADESQMIYDELGKQFLSTVKHAAPYGRSVYLAVSKDFVTWTEPRLIFHADGEDQVIGRQRIAERVSDPRWVPMTINQPSHYNVDIYNMPVFPYEGMYLGLPMKFHQTGPTPIGNQDGFHMVEMVSTRDLREWQRVAGRAIFIPLSHDGLDRYDTGTIVPPTRPIVRDGELWFYYSGMRRRFQPSNIGPLVDGRRRYVSVPDNGAILLAKLRQDGFVSMDAGHQEGTLLTVRLNLEGNRMFVNADASGGRIRAEILGPTDTFSLDRSVPVRGDHLKAELKWKGTPDWAALEGKQVRIRFHLRQASLFAFWTE